MAGNVCRLVQGLLTLADPVLHFTDAGNYDRRTLNTIATRSSQHHNRLALCFATQAVVGNMTNRYYRVHTSVITDDNHNGMTTRKASRLCGRNSSARAYVRKPPYNESMLPWHAIGWNVWVSHRLMRNSRILM